MPVLAFPVLAAALGCAASPVNASLFKLKAMSQDPMQAEVIALKVRFPDHAGPTAAIISISHQRLYLYRDERLVKTYPVSTSKFGPGYKEGSFMTPLGAHYIRAKIGDGAPLGTIFKGRKDTHRVVRINYDAAIAADTDYITTRILWLEGLEPGINRGKGIDSYARYIYIHGTHEEHLIRHPASHGCVRMTNRDVVELYDEMREGDLVLIVE
jgi:lipoprotein-anchoring transpeptidase ErfK/SrfK